MKQLISHSESGIERISNIIGGLKTFMNNSEEEMEIVDPENLINISTTFIAHKIPSYLRLHNDIQSTSPIKARMSITFTGSSMEYFSLISAGPIISCPKLDRLGLNI